MAALPVVHVQGLLGNKNVHYTVLLYRSVGCSEQVQELPHFLGPAFSAAFAAARWAAF